MKKLIKLLLGRTVIDAINRIRFSPKRMTKRIFKYDQDRLMAYSGCFSRQNREQLRAFLVMTYHIVEKGLTMPNRRFTFGVDVVRDLMRLIDEFSQKFDSDPQVDHAIGVLKAYWDLHAEAGKQSPEDAELWQALEAFLARFPSVPAALQPHYTKDAFYRDVDAPFPAFAASRHTLRHYSDKPLSIERIKAAVEIAMTTPTACNRQHCRVYCLSDKAAKQRLLEIQGGSRGFGHLADKVLIVTADLEDISFVRERDDLFTNGGMFLMNLCYALHYEKIAHCILNWSRAPAEDRAMREFLKIKPSESVVAILTCGEPTDEFDVCASPRDSIEEHFVEL